MVTNPVFIIAEAGSNWRLGSPSRDIKMAKTLIDVASDAGADAIKFQTYRAHSVYVPNAGNSDYLSNAGIKESINKIFEDLSMPYEMIPKLAEYAKIKKIEFMSTPFSVEDAKAIDPYTNYHKIASYEISHLRLIEYIASTGKPVFLSTGGTNKEEIRWALEKFSSNGGGKITLLQTTAKYPAPIDSLNLKAMIDLKNEFNVDVGLSDHSTDPVIGPVTATALGASVIEKHFTLDKKMEGPDHKASLEPNELKSMVDSIRNIEEAMGDGIKRPTKSEKPNIDIVRKSIVAKTEIKKGEIFSENNLTTKRPGTGLSPMEWDSIIGKVAKRDYQIDDLL